MVTLKEILDSYEKIGEGLNLSHALSHFTSDSRQVRKGSLFFAIKGTSLDGHTRIEEAFKNGASAIVIEDPTYFGARTILVRNSRQAFALSAVRWFENPSHAFHLVGITGTNGKTTSAYLLDQIWRSFGKTTGLIGTVETRIADEIESSSLTTPGPFELQETFFKMKQKKVSHTAMEVSSIALDQYRTLGSKFEVALFTNFTQDHLDYHGSMEEYFKAKCRLFTEYKIPRAVINAEDPISKKLIAAFKGEAILFGLHPGCNFRILDVEVTKEGSRASLQTPEGLVELQTPLFGVHNIFNCVGVLATQWALGFKLPAILKAIKDAPGAPGRLERVMKGEKYPSIFVDYAHSDDALKNVLSVMAKFRKGGKTRVITVFGCGGDRDRLKRPKMAQVASQFSDITIATSDNPRTEDPNQILNDIEPGIDASRTFYIREVDRKEAIRRALSLATPEDLVILAGKGHETYQILGKEKVPFDDRQVVREYYSS